MTGAKRSAGLRCIGLPLCCIAAVLFTLWLVCNLWVLVVGGSGIRTRDAVGTGYDMIIVPGAGIRNNRPTPMLQDRLDTAAALYRAGVSDRLFISGDHSSENYNEVAVMRAYLLEQGIPPEVLLEDHEGFDTYSTLYHARQNGAGTAVVVTQRYHLYRGIFVGRQLSVDTVGVVCDKYIPVKIVYYHFRETFSRCKAAWDCLTDRVV